MTLDHNAQHSYSAGTICILTETTLLRRYKFSLALQNYSILSTLGREFRAAGPLAATLINVSPLIPHPGVLGGVRSNSEGKCWEFRACDLTSLLERRLFCYFVFHTQCEHLLPEQRLAAYL